MISQPAGVGVPLPHFLTDAVSNAHQRIQRFPQSLVSIGRSAD
jgi:hypothetical protein